MTNILITGGTGLVGRRLISLLLKEGYTVGVLSRRDVKLKNVQSFLWTDFTVDIEALRFADVIVHLAGANVGEKRWTRNRKKEITNSRVATAELIRKGLFDNKIKIDAFICASAVGFYGEGADDVLTEKSSNVTKDFLSDVCEEWENKAQDFSSICRVASVRIGFVLDKNADGFKKLVKPVRFGIGASLGTGNQYMSWIHLDDLVHIFLTVIKDDCFSGPVNACSPNPLTNSELTKKVARHLQKPLFMPNVPQIILRLLLGEMADLALVGYRVFPKKLIDHGFTFQYPTLEGSLKEIYN